MELALINVAPIKQMPSEVRKPRRRWVMITAGTKKGESYKWLVGNLQASVTYSEIIRPLQTFV